MSESADIQTSELSEQEKRAQLEDLIARAAAKDATKDHDSAADLYSQATELQDELNGEMSPENAELLFAYGKSLYNVAVSKSDVLGSKVAGEPESGAPSSSNAASSSGSKSTSGSLVKDAIANSAQSTSAKPAKKESEPSSSKPLFQFTGDENFVDSESEDEDAGEEGEEDDDDDDDFANAFEVLDLARVLYKKHIEASEEGHESEGDSVTEMPPHIRHLKERLADTHDLQAEISLEGERFSDAVEDFKAVLKLRYSLHPFEDPSIAECHYKLSLALEFASVRQGDEETGEKSTIDEEMRKEAASEMQNAIESCKIRMAQEEKKLEAQKDEDEDKANATKRKIANVKEIVTDMEQRVISYSCYFPQDCLLTWTIAY